MSDDKYISACEGRLQVELNGTFRPLATKVGIRTAFINDEFDVLTIGELINACGYTAESVHGKHVEISILEIV